MVKTFSFIKSVSQILLIKINKNVNNLTVNKNLRWSLWDLENI